MKDRSTAYYIHRYAYYPQPDAPQASAASAPPEQAGAKRSALLEVGSWRVPRQLQGVWVLGFAH
jgi:hypothetical protein